MSDTLSGMNALNANTYTNSMNSTGNNIQNTINNSDLSQASDDELLSVCKDFEEYFAEQMVKSMIKMANVSGEEDADDYSSIFGLSSDSSSSGMSTMSNYYGGQLVTMLSQALCDSDNGKGLGLAQTLYEQMKRNYGVSDTTSNTTGTGSTAGTTAGATADTTTSETSKATA